MICSISSPPIRRRPGEGRGPRGFTLVELLAVMLILAFLIALLLPAINGALRTAKNAAVGGEINQLAQALNAFKAKYGEYPPSRILLVENGNYGQFMTNTALGTGDITIGQLAQRSVAALRKYFPRVVLNTSSGAVFANNSTLWYDFNGDGCLLTNCTSGVPQAYILQGHECLVFFLGGIPVQTSTGYAMTGFGKDPTNPFSNSLVGNSMYSNNRQPALFEFNAGQLAQDPTNPYPSSLGLVLPGIPGYLDSLGNSPPGSGSGLINFYAYFSAYGNGGYDPNDVNFATAPDAELDSTGAVAELNYSVGFPIPPFPGPNPAISPAPNPYTSTTTVPATGVTTFLNPQTFQIISSGLDGLYGVGGQYSPGNSAESLPFDATNTITSDAGIRLRERDNITNFHNGKLE